MKMYVTLCGIRRSRKVRIPAGTELEIPDEIAAEWLSHDPPMIKALDVKTDDAQEEDEEDGQQSRTPATSRPQDGVLGGGQFLASASARDTVAFLRSAVQADVERIEEAERARPDGPRKSVLEAIDARAEQLLAEAAAAGDGRTPGAGAEDAKE